MTKKEFLCLMRFPTEWELWSMYPDELFNVQLSFYEPGHEDSAEHDRNGAFHWWLRQNTSKEQLEKLLRLAALDPDQLLGNDLRRYIRKNLFFDEQMEKLDKELFD